MNIYVETNFILELVLHQEFQKQCEKLLTFSRRKGVSLILPSYCFVESINKLGRQKNQREELKRALNVEVNQLSRTPNYSKELKTFQSLDALFARSVQEEQERFDKYRAILLKIAKIIPLTIEIIQEAINYEDAYQLEKPDAIVYASVLSHLSETSDNNNCFINKDRADFYIPEIKTELGNLNCRLISRFDQGANFVSNQLLPKTNNS